MIRIDSDGLTLIADRQGKGSKLLFITGTAGDLRNPNSPLQSDLINHFDVASYDQRGMGRSDKPDISYSMHDYAQDAMAVLDHLEWETADIAGYSFGGMVAQEIAIRWPQRVNKLVLMATTAGGAGGSSYPIEQFEGLPDEEYARRRLEVIDLSFNAEWQAANPQRTRERISLAIEANNRFRDEPGHASGRTRQLAARAQHNTYDRLEQIRAETLVIAGLRDGQATVTAQKAMAEKITHCHFKTVDGSHQMLQESDEVYTLLRQFLLSAVD